MNKTKDKFFFMKKPNRNSGFVKTCDEHILGAISTSTRLAEKCFLRPLGTLFAIKALAYSCAQKGPNGDDFCLKKKERYLVSQVLLMQFRKTQVHCCWTKGLGTEFVVPFFSRSQVVSKKSSNDNFFIQNDKVLTQTSFLNKKDAI